MNPDPPTGRTAASLPGATTAQAKAAAGLVAALSRAAKASTLYDAHNTLVRQFLADLKARAEEATASGALPLDVLPFDIACGGESVYHEDDREKSLAFRLYRDGVRRLTLAPGVPFDELLRLLEILAIRFSGIRQAEEDVVTLLRKAEFEGIELVAVEGYAPDEEAPELTEVVEGRKDEGLRPPAGFDRPFPKLPAPATPEWRAVPDAALAALRAGETEDALPANALRLARELLAHAGQGALEPGEVTGYLAELRNFLVADAQLEPLAALADLAAAQPPGGLRDAVLRGLADPRLVDAVLRAIPEGTRALPPEAAKLLPFVPAGAVLERLAGEADAVRRDVLVRLASARLPADAESVVAHLTGLPAAVARDLWRAVRDRAPDRAEEAAAVLLDHPDAGVQVDALQAVARAERRVAAAPLVRLLAAPQEPVRLAAAAALERHGDVAAARAAAAALTERRSYSTAEAEALGRVVGRLQPAVAQRLFQGWLEEKRGLLASLSGSGHGDLLRWAAVSGLGAMSGVEAEALIHAAAAKAGPELKRHCVATLARRRAEGRRHG